MPRKRKSPNPSTNPVASGGLLAQPARTIDHSSAAATVERVVSIPSGKLGLLIEQLEDAPGAVMSDLMAATDWQAHTVRAALSRLRVRGFRIELEDDGHQK